jgi:hypothetical protein
VQRLYNDLLDYQWHSTLLVCPILQYALRSIKCACETMLPWNRSLNDGTEAFGSDTIAMAPGI